MIGTNISKALLDPQVKLEYHSRYKNLKQSMEWDSQYQRKTTIVCLRVIVNHKSLKDSHKVACLTLIKTKVAQELDWIVLNTEQLIEDFLLKKVTGIKTGWVSLSNITIP